MKSDGPRMWRVRVDAELGHRPLHGPRIELPELEQRVQRRDRDVLRVHLEEPAERLTRLGATEAVGAERQQPTVQIGRDLLRQRPHVVARRNNRPLRVATSDYMRALPEQVAPY